MNDEQVGTNYYDTQGNLIKKTKDGSHDVVILKAIEVKLFYKFLGLFSGYKDAKLFNVFVKSCLGQIYDVASFEAFYNKNAESYGMDNLQNTFYDEAGERVQVPVESATALYMKSGRITIGDENILGTSPNYIPPGLILEAQGENRDYVAYLHTEPTHGLGLIEYSGDDPWGKPLFSSNQAGDRPSLFDKAHYLKEGSIYKGIIVRPTQIVFYDKNAYFTIPRTNATSPN